MQEQNSDSKKQKISIDKPKQMICSGSNKIQRLCLNPHCQQYSLICNDLDCQDYHKENHSSCLSIPFKGITQMLKDRAVKQLSIDAQISEIQDNFIQQVKTTRQLFTQTPPFGDLQSRYIDIAEQIYNKGNSKCLKGKEALQFYNRLEQLNCSPKLSSAASQIDNYQKLLKKHIEEITEQKNKIYEFLCPSKQPEPAFEEEPKIDSNILSSVANVSENSQQIKCLMKFLDNPLKLVRLFRGSQHNFKVAAFHEQCDQVSDTVVIIRTEFNKIIGGYTHEPWRSPNSDTYVANPKVPSFIFSLDMKEKFINTKPERSICNNATYGPTFGSGQIYISDECNNNKDSRADFPSCYNREGNNKLIKGQQSTKMFSGVNYGRDFKVIQYQVFKVVYNQE